jgi:large subunit ribosomal protein L21e
MVKRKDVRTRGKFQLSKYFQTFSEGDAVTVTKEKAMQPSFPARLQGRSGVITNKRGRAYVVNIKDQNKDKQHIIAPIHLKKIKQIEKQ